MDEAFYIGSHPASAFGAQLLASYTVGGSTLTRSYAVSRTGSHITPCATQYGLRSITLPVDIYGDTPEDAAAKHSALTAALLESPVELYLPDGGIYTALLEDPGKRTVWDDAGCCLSCTYTLSGYKHGPLETVITRAGQDDQLLFFAAGNAPQMECRILTEASGPGVPDVPGQPSEEPSAFDAVVRYPDGGSCTIHGVKSGDVLLVDGIEKQVLVNGQNAFRSVTAISGWPVVTPGENLIAFHALDMTDTEYTIEYYPIFV